MEGASLFQEKPVLKSSAYPGSPNFLDRLGASSISTVPAFGQVLELGSTVQPCHTLTAALSVVCTLNFVGSRSISSTDEQANSLDQVGMLVVPALGSRADAGKGRDGGINYRSYWYSKGNLDSDAGMGGSDMPDDCPEKGQYNGEDIPTSENCAFSSDAGVATKLLDDTCFWRRECGTLVGDQKRRRKTTNVWLIALLSTLIATWLGFHLLNTMGYFRSIPFLCGKYLAYLLRALLTLIRRVVVLVEWVFGRCRSASPQRCS
jgi:hypothetical protein